MTFFTNLFTGCFSPTPDSISKYKDEIERRAFQFAKDNESLLNYIAIILNEKNFNQNPKKYLQNMRVRIVERESLDVEERAYKFFDTIFKMD